MQCSWCKRRGTCQPDDLRPWWVPGLWNIEGIGLLCDKCDDHGDPPHARYLEGLLRTKVSRTSSELIAAYTYPVYAKAIAIPGNQASLAQGG